MLDWFSKKTASVDDKDFVSLSSHELRTPLSVIKWYTEMLLDEDAGPLTDEQRKYLKTIESSNQQAIDLVRSLLNVSRLDLGTFRIVPSDVNLKDVLEEVLASLESIRSRKNLSLVKDYDETVSSITTDRKMCMVALKELLLNAYLYTQAGKQVTISLRNVKKGEGKVSKDGVLFTVKDEGIGIPVGEQDKVFTKMYKGSNSKDSDSKGSGLGLYIVKTIACHLQGDTWFYSDEGGTSFSLLFPGDDVPAKEGRTALD